MKLPGRLPRVLLLWTALPGLVPSLLAAATLQIGQNFTGSRYGPDSSASPADGDGAVGPQHFVEFINGRFSVYDKSSGTRVQTMTDLQFWTASGINFPSTVGVSDPRIIYDPGTQRWFASMVDLSVDTRGRQQSNHFLLGVSATSDPTGAWHAFTFRADPNNMNFADFPTLGVDQNGVYLSGDMFDRTGNPIGPTIVTMPIGDLTSSTPTVARLQLFGPFTYTSMGDVVQPVITTGTASTPEEFLAVGDLGVDRTTGNPNGAHTTLVLSSLASGPLTNASLVTPSTILTVSAYTVPIDPTQPDGSSNLADNDARIAASVRRVGDIIYATHAVEANNRAAIRWYKISATDHSLIESGTIADPNLELFYPSIAANDSGTVVIGCNGADGNTFVGSYAVAGQPVNGSLSFGPLALLKSGTASYQNPDPTGESRCGDYSATCVDPVDPTRFWTIQMIAVGRTTWATQITELMTNGGTTNTAPMLSFSRQGENLTISWPATVTGAQLQFSPTLGPGATWTSVAQTPVVNNGNASVTVPVAASEGFFRLAMGTGTGGA
jgi:hypothetical protein